MSETFILIPGRTSRQGTTLNEGKFTRDYLEETSTLMMCPEDMQRLGLTDGDRVRLSNAQGRIELPVKTAKGDELSPGVLFLSYGPMASQLMGGDTQGTGMPDSKSFDVQLEKTT
ncbi:MAG: formylmethanofuran dehydrogenase [Planctomycetes bacterium]|nr:formylmethanofuran dehydrogenase [Planctomycetota bacterium]